MIEQRHVTALDVKTDEKRKKKSIKVVLKNKKQYMYIYICAWFASLWCMHRMCACVKEGEVVGSATSPFSLSFHFPLSSTTSLLTFIVVFIKSSPLRCCPPISRFLFFFCFFFSPKLK